MRTLRFAVFLSLLTACTPPASPPPDARRAPPDPRRYSQIMTDVARHHEMLGRALIARRWELAGYSVRELREDLAELPGAAPPDEALTDITPIARGFPDEALPPLERALAARDLPAARAAYAAVSTACNGCHTRAGFGFLVVPTEPGAAVPDITSSAGSTPDAATVADAVTDAATATADVTAPPRPLPRAGASCDDRIGCARGLVCCTHGGIPMPATHYGRCMTSFHCSTIPAARPEH